MTPADLSLAYGCPEHIACAMARDAGPLLIAVKTVGPLRCRWAGYIPRKTVGGGGYAETNAFAAWSLDGQRVTMKAIYQAARMQP